MTAEVFAPAKINLALHLTGLRDDGYHLLESLVVFVDVGDRVRAELAGDLSLTVSGPFADGVPTDENNLVLKAAMRLQDLRQVDAGAALHLDKHLPHGAGIGGGSSDAAAAIKLLAKLWNVPPLTPAEGLALGADVPVCLAGPQPLFMRGIGELLEPAPRLPEGWLLLVNPGVPVPTGAVFALHDKLYDFSPLGLEPLDVAFFDTWLLGQRNDLTKVAREPEIAPVVGDVLDMLWTRSECCEMSGSGSTCWAWFNAQDAAEAAAQDIAAKRPEWWVRAAKIISH